MVVDSGSTDGSPERARAAGAVVHEIPPEEFGHGRTRNLGVELARGELVVFTSQDAVADDSGWLARLVAAARSGPGRRGRVRPPAPSSGRPAARALLPRLHVRARAARPAARAGAELTFETTLFSNVNAAIPRAILERYPFRDDLTMSEDQEWSRRVLRDGLLARLRAARGRPPFACVHRALGVPAVLRLGRVGGARLRRRRRVARRAPARGRAVRAGGARMALGTGPPALDPVHGRLRARQVRRPPARAAPPPAAARARRRLARRYDTG